MSTVALCFASTYISVFALGLQSLNVNQGHYWAAAGTSLLIGASTMVLYKFMPSANLPEMTGYLAGGVTGITSSMWFHRRAKAWWAAWRSRRGNDAPPYRNPPPLRLVCPACGLPEGVSCPRLVCERYMDEHADVFRSTRLH